MEGKKSFVLYSDYDELFNELSDEDAGKLIKHILEYVNDRDPKTDNPIIKLSFIPIKKQLQRDLDSWVNTVSKRSEGGKLGNLKRWHKDIYNKVVNSELSIEEGLKEAENRKASDTDRNRSHTIANIAVNDTVTVNVNDNDINKFDEFWDLYHQISKLPKTDLQPAKKYWNRLTKSEQEKAKSNIQNYVDTVNDPKYIVKCRTYLSNKRFNDEFESYKPKRLTDEEAKKMTPQEEMDYLRMVLKRDGNG